MIPFATSAETFFPLATIRAGSGRRTDKAYENSILILSATAILALASPCLAAKPDFSKLEGSYRAKYQTNVTNSDVKGNVDVDISVSANGGKAVIQIVGYGYSRAQA